MAGNRRHKSNTYDPMLGKVRKEDVSEQQLKNIKAGLEHKADINHTHDDRYAPLGHAHTGTYAAANHNHDERYAGINHNHNSAYAALNHNHDSAYAAKNHNHDGVYQPAGSYAPAAHTHDGYLTQHQDISGKQDKNDNTLNTTSKTIVGAINELFSSLASLPSSGGSSGAETFSEDDYSEIIYGVNINNPYILFIKSSDNSLVLAYFKQYNSANNTTDFADTEYNYFRVNGTWSEGNNQNLPTITIDTQTLIIRNTNTTIGNGLLWGKFATGLEVNIPTNNPNVYCVISNFGVRFLAYWEGTVIERNDRAYTKFITEFGVEIYIDGSASDNGWICVWDIDDKSIYVMFNDTLIDIGYREDQGTDTDMWWSNSD